MSMAVVGNTASLFLLISFILCVIFDLIFRDQSMYFFWKRLLPGFEWLSFSSFILGSLESYAYGWFISFIWVPLYNFLAGETCNSMRKFIKAMNNFRLKKI